MEVKKGCVIINGNFRTGGKIHAFLGSWNTIHEIAYSHRFKIYSGLDRNYISSQHETRFEPGKDNFIHPNHIPNQICFNSNPTQNPTGKIRIFLNTVIEK